MHFLYSAGFLVALVPIVFGSVRPQTPVSGGINTINNNDETAQQMASFAVAEIGDSFSLVSVEKAGKQVVAGLMYHLTVNVDKIRMDGTKSYTCDVKVLSQEWIGRLELSEFSCKSSPL